MLLSVSDNAMYTSLLTLTPPHISLRIHENCLNSTTGFKPVTPPDRTAEMKKPRLYEASCFRGLQINAVLVGGVNQIYVRVAIRTEEALISAITRTPSPNCNTSQLSLVMTDTISKPASIFTCTGLC